MTAAMESVKAPIEYPPLGDLRNMMAQNPVPVIAPGTVQEGSMGGEEPTKQAQFTLNAFNAALETRDAARLTECFFPNQAFWKDQLALTYHLRSFSTPSGVAAGLLETTQLRGVVGALSISGSAQFIPATPVLQFIDCAATFRTASPAATCSGRLILLPVKRQSDVSKESIEWKIWILSTKLENLEIHPEDESLLKAPKRQLVRVDTIEPDVFIIGGGNAAFALAARLKAFGVDSVMAERNARVGDNWALRYDYLKFHVPTTFCQLPYLDYPEELCGDHLLTKEELAEQARRYVEALNLNIITSAKIKATSYDQSTKLWTVKFQTPDGERTAVSKHLVQATGVSSQKPYTPKIADEHLCKGVRLHSADYKNATILKEKGVKSAIIVGSANTGFDVLQDCHDAGLKTTMVIRSPTYIVPVEYVCNPRSLGAYNFGVEAGDRMFLTLPACIDGQLGRGLFAQFALQEPDRYVSLAAAGFPVLDSRDPDCALMHNLLERAGGHYVDVGATSLIAEGKAGLKAGAEPVAYTETGLRFSDGSIVDADAILWCTGFADKDARKTAAEVLGGGNTDGNVSRDKNVLGPEDVAARLDATWNLDEEGEIRGMWKRHLNMENYWIMGGYTQQHRWHSRTLALQIKAALEGVLPPAYRDTPTLKVPQ
ncbi:hypothetical protein K456DRAFT_1934595 [Colletotrichum gloeosporioides 23]|nr:hypothetical protein K456DRAFT_1934595 [Colletotrichum gloeosporioides 23]